MTDPESDSEFFASEGRLTSELPEPGHVRGRHHLRVLEAGAEGGHVRAIEGRLKGIENYAVGTISNSVNALPRRKALYSFGRLYSQSAIRPSGNAG